MKKDIRSVRAIMFVCFGNVCRSPMAEFVFGELARRAGRLEEFLLSSSATACEEGRPVHEGTLEVLRRHGIPARVGRSVLLIPSDAEKFDLFVGMDEFNVRAISRILGEDASDKICKLLDFTAEPHDVADPWYTGDFDAAYRDISEGCASLLDAIIGEEKDER